MLIVPFTFSIDAVTFAHNYAKNRFINQKPECILLIVHQGNIWLLPRKEPANSSESHTPSVSVVVPAYNEEELLESTVRSLYDQTLRPKNVIVVDDYSTDRTPEICQQLREELGEDFVYVRRERNSGKANNINYAVEELADILGDITLVNDSDTTPHKTCIETLASHFTSDDVAAVTPYGYTTPPENPLARALHYGNSWNNTIFKFRKRAQGYRGGISVVCGACTAYRTEILKRLPIPERTKTEDTDYTWLLQENGYKVVYDQSAVAHSADIAKASGLCRQWFRWYSGIFQSIFVHGKQLLKARRMFWTTVLPALMESVPYSFGIVTLPLVAALNLAMPDANIPFFHMGYVKGFLLADFLFTTIPTAILSPKYLLRLPQIYLYKYVACALTVFAYSKTTYERLTGQQRKWGSAWSRSYVDKGQQYGADHKRVYESESR